MGPIPRWIIWRPSFLRFDLYVVVGEGGLNHPTQDGSERQPPEASNRITIRPAQAILRTPQTQGPSDRPAGLDTAPYQTYRKDNDGPSTSTERKVQRPTKGRLPQGIPRVSEARGGLDSHRAAPEPRGDRPRVPPSMSRYWRGPILSRDEIKEVPCPECKAAPGEPCRRTKAKHQRREVNHHPRMQEAQRRATERLKQENEHLDREYERQLAGDR